MGRGGRDLVDGYGATRVHSASMPAFDVHPQHGVAYVRAHDACREAEVLDWLRGEGIPGWGSWKEKTTVKIMIALKERKKVNEIERERERE